MRLESKQDNRNSPVKAKISVGGLALYELLNVRTNLQCWYSSDDCPSDSEIPMMDLMTSNAKAHDSIIRYGNFYGSIERGLPQFSEYGKGSHDPEDNRICAINELKVLADDLIASDHMTQNRVRVCLLYTSPSPRDRQKSRMPSSA